MQCLPKQIPGIIDNQLCKCLDLTVLSAREARVADPLPWGEDNRMVEQKTQTGEPGRRPLATRNSRFAKTITAALLRTPITPNQISIASLGFAGLGSAALIGAQGHPWLYVGAVIGIQLRLLCNLLDGMVAVEGGRGSPLGILYNEFPDRIADSMLIIAFGYAAGSHWLGWAGALAAALTAYIRVFGGALGQVQDFGGILSKPRRMALMSAACLLAMGEIWLSGTSWIMLGSAWVLLVGTSFTCITRARAVAGRIAIEQRTQNESQPS